MKWYRTDEKLPPSGVEILIRVGESYYLAEYQDSNWQFILKAGGYVPVKGIYWSEITPPEKK